MLLMCGRFLLTTPADIIAEAFGLAETVHVDPRYNIAPTQEAAVVRSEGDLRRLSMLRWGLVPRWSKDIAIGNRMINARSETVAEKPSFRDAFRKRRCLVPASGFYEWQKTTSGKQPMCIEMADSGVFAMAGLWERWEGGQSPLETFTILTTEPNELCAPIHNRMPVIVPRHAWGRWLDPAKDASAILCPYSGDMRAFGVSRHVNSPTNDDPSCLARDEGTRNPGP